MYQKEAKKFQDLTENDLGIVIKDNFVVNQPVVRTGGDFQVRPQGKV